MTEPATPRPRLSLFDAVMIIMGIMIGSAIFEFASPIASMLPSGWAVLGMWVVGGLLALCGALTYAELATTYPREGGEYVYLSRAYGRWLGLLFAWAEYWIIRPGSIGAMAYLFAIYFVELLPLPRADSIWQTYQVPAWACGSVLVLTGLNLLGVRSGKWTQNALTVVKTLGLLMVCVVGMFLAPSAKAGAALPLGDSPNFVPNYFLPLIFVMFAYGGWGDIACVAAEVRSPKKNLFRALVLGTVGVMLVYLLVNLAFLRALGHTGLAGRQAAAADIVGLRWGDHGRQAVSLLVCLSCLGAINGMVLTGSRIYYAMGTQVRAFAWLGRWNRWVDAPVVALLLQALVTIGLVLAFGPERSGFEKLVIFTTPVYWLFALLVGISLFVLRWRDPLAERPYRVLGYPFTPLVFCAMALVLIYNGVSYAIAQEDHYEALWSLILLAIGGVVCFVVSGKERE